VARGAIRALRTLPRKLAMSIGIGQTAATAAAGVSIPIVVTPIRLNATLSTHLTVPISIRNDRRAKTEEILLSQSLKSCSFSAARVKDLWPVVMRSSKQNRPRLGFLNGII